MMNPEWDGIPERDSGFPANTAFGKIHPADQAGALETLGFPETDTVSQNCHMRPHGSGRHCLAATKKGPAGPFEIRQVYVLVRP